MANCVPSELNVILRIPLSPSVLTFTLCIGSPVAHAKTGFCFCSGIRGTGETIRFTPLRGEYDPAAVPVNAGGLGGRGCEGVDTVADVGVDIWSGAGVVLEPEIIGSCQMGSKRKL